MATAQTTPSSKKPHSSLITVRVPDDYSVLLKDLVVERKYLTKDHSITISAMMAEAITDLLKKYGKQAA